MARVLCRLSVTGLARWPIGLAALAVAGACQPRAASPTPAPVDAAARPAPPLTLRLEAVQSTYHLGDGAKLKQQIEAAERAEKTKVPGGRRPGTVVYPDPPAVDLRLTITNTSKAALQMWDRGDDRGNLSLLLEGPGAVLATPIQFGTLKLMMDTPLVLDAGQTRTMEFTSLSSGPRGNAYLAYWTLPGDYRVGVVWATAIQPARKITDNRDDDFLAHFARGDWTAINLTSNAVTVKVISP